MKEKLISSERQELPARILLQIREGKRYNVLQQFTITSHSEYEREGVKEHDVTNLSLVDGLAQALKTQVSALKPHPEVDDWLDKLKEWIFNR